MTGFIKNPTNSQNPKKKDFVGVYVFYLATTIAIVTFMCQANGVNGDYQYSNSNEFESTFSVKIKNHHPRKLTSASSTCKISVGKYVTVLKHVNKCYGSCASLKQGLTKAEKTEKAVGKTTADANYLNIILQTTNYLKEYTYVSELCGKAAYNSAACIGCATDGNIFASQYAGYKRLYAECTSKLHGDCSEVCPYLKQVVNSIPTTVAATHGIALGCSAK